LSLRFGGTTPGVRFGVSSYERKMHMRKFARVAGLIGMALGLVMAGAPAAQAASVLEVEFTAEINLGCGLGSPVLTGSTPGVTTTTETSPYVHVLTRVTGGRNNCSFTVGAGTQVCLAEEESLKKTPPVNAGQCTIQGSGVVEGFCGLSAGHGSATIVTPWNTFDVDFYFTGVGGTLELTGLITKRSTGQTGKFTATVEAIPPTPVLTPAGGTCTAGTASIFTVVGAGVGEMTP
jgi:hypothetical protein